MTKKSGKSRQITSRASVSKKMMEDQTSDRRRAKYLAELEGYRKANEERKQQKQKEVEGWASAQVTESDKETK